MLWLLNYRLTSVSGYLAARSPLVGPLIGVFCPLWPPSALSGYFPVHYEMCPSFLRLVLLGFEGGSAGGGAYDPHPLLRSTCPGGRLEDEGGGTTLKPRLQIHRNGVIQEVWVGITVWMGEICRTPYSLLALEGEWPLV